MPSTTSVELNWTTASSALTGTSVSWRGGSLGGASQGARSGTSTGMCEGRGMEWVWPAHVHLVMAGGSGY